MRASVVSSTVALLALVIAGVQGAWNLDTAIDALDWARVSYCSQDSINNWDCPTCPRFPGTINAKAVYDPIGHNKDSFGFAAYNPGKNTIAYSFRGTENTAGWIEDFDFFQTDYPNCTNTGCKVHEGLWWGYNRMREAGLWDHLQKLVYAYPNATIICTGHSMGAAQAAFAYLDIVLNLKGHIGKKMMYNYGCPRIGNPAFVKYMEDTVEPHGEHYRHTNYGDPVPHLPPRWLKIGGEFLHSPREVFFENAFANPQTHPPKICKGTVTKEDPTCSDQTPLLDPHDWSGRNHTTYLDRHMSCVNFKK